MSLGRILLVFISGIWVGAALMAVQIKSKKEKDYKSLYEDLCKDVVEKGQYNLCKICIVKNLPCQPTAHSDLDDCESCKLKCRCRDCIDCNLWEWQGEDGA